MESSESLLSGRATTRGQFTVGQLACGWIFNCGEYSVTFFEPPTMEQPGSINTTASANAAAATARFMRIPAVSVGRADAARRETWRALMA